MTTSTDNPRPPDEKLPLIERVGVNLLRRASQRHGARTFGDDEIHTLNDEEQRALLDIERRTVYRAAVVGSITGFIGAVAEIVTGPELDLFDDPLHAWIFMGALVGLSTAGELLYLYFLSLQAVDDLAFAAGLDLREDDEVGQRLVHALARAALEAPNPVTPVLGVDPRREASRLWLVAATLIYKAKVGITNFILKALLRRMLARTGLRFVAAYVAIPVLAIWDAVVIYKVLREARIRVIGPSAAVVLTQLIIDHRHTPPSLPAQQALLGAVASCIMGYSDMHPNLQTLLELLYHRFDEVHEASIALRTEQFLESLTALESEEQRMVLELLAVAAILTGRLRRRGRKLLERAWGACGQPLHIDRVKALAHAFVQGQPITRQHLDALTREASANLP